jgi:oligopeptide/dipeptide ABC transporter ATP-binding protein
MAATGPNPHLPELGPDVVRVEGLKKVFGLGRAGSGPSGSGRSRKGRVVALDGVDLAVAKGDAVGVVGESGSGKTTLARCVLRLTKPSGGTIYFEGTDISSLSGRRLREFRRRAQIVFQDPFGSLDPRFSVKRALAEALIVHRVVPPREVGDRTAELLRRVGLPMALLERRRHELSGGEAQRVTIARALATNPRFMVLDEPTSALDASARLRVIGLLKELRSTLQMTYLVISHDLSTVSYLCDYVFVMYRGRVVEQGPAQLILQEPSHPYTRALLAALPSASRGQPQTKLRPQAAVDAPPSWHGCAVAPRCPYATPECEATAQRLVKVAPQHKVACHRVARGDLLMANEDAGKQITKRKVGLDNRRS